MSDRIADDYQDPIKEQPISELNLYGSLLLVVRVCPSCLKKRVGETMTFSTGSLREIPNTRMSIPMSCMSLNDWTVDLTSSHAAMLLTKGFMPDFLPS